MRSLFTISFAITSILAASSAFAADNGDAFRRRIPAGQQFLRPAVKGPAVQPRFSIVRPPVATFAPPALKPVAQLPIAPQIKATLPIKAQFTIPTNPIPKPTSQFRIQPAPQIQTPVLDVKQTLPVLPTRQIAVEGGDAASLKAAAPVAPVQNFAPAQNFAPVQTFAATPAAPDVTGTLKAEVPQAQQVVPQVAAAVAPPTTQMPADTQALIQDDSAAAPQPEAPAAAPPVAVPEKKTVRVYVQGAPTYTYADQNYGYQPRVRYYSYDYGNGGGYGYGGDGCQ